MIFWNGKSSDDVCVRVENYPTYATPVRKRERLSIPGRNGDVLISQDAFESYTQEYDVYLSAEARSLPRVARMVANWVYGPKGYARLEDTYDLDTFRMAAYDGAMDVENIFNKFGRATLKFLCKPQRWYKTGQQPIELTQGAKLQNPSAFLAQPLIVISGSGAGTLVVGNTSINILALDGTMQLDCETQNATVDGSNANSSIYAPEFPTLGKTTEVTWSGDIESVMITPRWWTI